MSSQRESSKPRSARDGKRLCHTARTPTDCTAAGKPTPTRGRGARTEQPFGRTCTASIQNTSTQGDRNPHGKPQLQSSITKRLGNWNSTISSLEMPEDYKNIKEKERRGAAGGSPLLFGSLLPWYYLVENAHLNGSQRQRDTPHSIHQQVKKRQKERENSRNAFPSLRRFPLRPVHAAEPWACRGLGAGTSCQPPSRFLAHCWCCCASTPPPTATPARSHRSMGTHCALCARFQSSAWHAREQ